MRRETSNAAAIVSTFFPMHWAGNIAASHWGIRHAHLCFEPFPFFHDREVKAAYPAPKRALLEYLAAVYGRIDRKGVLEADRLLTLNRASAASVERVYGRSDATPTYAGVDTEFFHPYSDEELADLRERHGEGPLAIHSTDFSPIKRTDLALRAFAAAQRSLPNGSAKLLVTSTREDRNGLAQMWDLARTLDIDSRVEFLGFVPYEDLPRYYSAADVLIQTGTASLTGATTMSLPVEALACGTAVIRSDATDEDVEDGVSGYLIDPANSEATVRSSRRFSAIAGAHRRWVRRAGERSSSSTAGTVSSTSCSTLCHEQARARHRSGRLCWTPARGSSPMMGVRSLGRFGPALRTCRMSASTGSTSPIRVRSPLHPGVRPRFLPPRGDRRHGYDTRRRPPVRDEHARHRRHPGGDARAASPARSIRARRSCTGRRASVNNPFVKTTR